MLGQAGDCQRTARVQERPTSTSENRGRTRPDRSSFGQPGLSTGGPVWGRSAADARAAEAVAWARGISGALQVKGRESALRVRAIGIAAGLGAAGLADFTAALAAPGAALGSGAISMPKFTRSDEGTFSCAAG
jgi:hypothetical protein